MLNLHTFWSISVSIALVEALFPARAEQPWLGRLGDSIVALLFLIGCAASIGITLKGDRFVAAPAQFATAGIAALALIVAAFLLPRRQPQTAAGPTPSAWGTGAVALILGLAILFTPPTLNWGAVVVMLTIDVAFLLFVRLFSRRATWTRLHTFSLAAGGALAYGLHAFAAHPLFGTVLAARISNAVFLAAAVEVILIGARRTSRALAFAPTQPVTE
jgi:general stress protein CsbA